MLRKSRAFILPIVLLAFAGSSIQVPVFAQIDPLPFMPKPGVMVHLSPQFSPAYLKGIVIHPEDPFKFDFIIYKGDKPLTYAQKKEEYTKLTRYFLASLAIPDDDQWVNLSPYEKDRIIKDDFGKTEMGRDLLAQDYMLKQITASLIYPEDRLGKEFWNRVYDQAQKQFGTTDVPVNTFNKVWILPDDALIYEKGNGSKSSPLTAYVLKNNLRVMLEEDYLSLQKHFGIEKAPSNETHSIVSNIVRQIVLPELQREVNEGENFAPLRQVYSGMLLATWFKRTLKQSLLGHIYANKGKVKGVEQDTKTNEEIYRQYLKAYRKGVFNFIKEDTDRLTNETVPRKYFSGGMGNYAMMTKLTGGDIGITRDSVIGNAKEKLEMSKEDVADFAMQTEMIGPSPLTYGLSNDEGRMKYIEQALRQRNTQGLGKVISGLSDYSLRKKYAVELFARQVGDPESLKAIMPALQEKDLPLLAKTIAAGGTGTLGEESTLELLGIIVPELKPDLRKEYLKSIENYFRPPLGNTKEYLRYTRGSAFYAAAQILISLNDADLAKHYVAVMLSNLKFTGIEGIDPSIFGAVLKISAHFSDQELLEPAAQTIGQYMGSFALNDRTLTASTIRYLGSLVALLDNRSPTKIDLFIKIFKYTHQGYLDLINKPAYAAVEKILGSFDDDARQVAIRTLSHSDHDDFGYANPRIAAVFDMSLGDYKRWLDQGIALAMRTGGGHQREHLSNKQRIFMMLAGFTKGEMSVYERLMFLKEGQEFNMDEIEENLPWAGDLFYEAGDISTERLHNILVEFTDPVAGKEGIFRGTKDRLKLPIEIRIRLFPELRKWGGDQISPSRVFARYMELEKSLPQNGPLSREQSSYIQRALAIKSILQELGLEVSDHEQLIGIQKILEAAERELIYEDQEKQRLKTEIDGAVMKDNAMVSLDQNFSRPPVIKREEGGPFGPLFGSDAAMRGQENESRKRIIGLLNEKLKERVGKYAAGGMNEEKMVDLVKYLGTEQSDLISSLTHDYGDLEQWPERPMIKLGGRDGLPTIWILGWRKIKSVVKEKDGKFVTRVSFDSTPIHSHGSSEAALYVFGGSVVEERFEKSEIYTDGRGVETLIKEGSTHSMTKPYIHLIRAPGEMQDGEVLLKPDEPFLKEGEKLVSRKVVSTSVSIHLYDPPLTLMELYEIDHAGRLQSRGQWFDDLAERDVQASENDAAMLGIPRGIFLKKPVVHIIDMMTVINYGVSEGAREGTYAAMMHEEPSLAHQKERPFGGIDLNSANLNLRIKRDGNGMPLPFDQQEPAQFSNIEGLDPVVVSITPASQSPVFAYLVSQP